MLKEHAPQTRLRRVLEEEPAVRWAYLFGSAARGSHFRDLDVAVMLDETAGLQVLGGLAAALEEAANGVAVDVVDLSAAAPSLAARIAHEGVMLIDRASESRKLWEVDVVRVALDLQPWLREFERLRRMALTERVNAHGRSRQGQ